MPELNDKDVLLNARFNLRFEQALKEGLILCKATDSRKLMLEKAPDIVRLQSSLLFMGQQDLLFQNFVIILRVLIELTHLNALDEAILLLGWATEDLEQPLSLVVVGLWLVRELDVNIDMGRCSRVHMV